MPRAASQTTTKAATKSANAKTKGEGKAKRAPSAYNVFMGEHLKKWREENPDKLVKEGMAAVAAMWREAPENPKRGQEPAAKKTKAVKEKTKAKKPKKAETSDDEEGGSE